MSNDHTILVVDDDVFMQATIEEVIGERYRAIRAGSGPECLQIAAAQRPDLVLLDVGLPGMDGYEVCRALKADPDLGSIPIIFVSGNDHIDFRLRGYEAGAEDYIVKPFDSQELLAKIANLLNKLTAHTQLREMASYASQTAMTAMSSMGELGTLLQTLQSFNACSSFDALLDATHNCLVGYGLEGATQIRSPGGAITHSSRGEATPLEASVIGHMAGMERIVQFRNRLSITYPHVSLLISNMPLEDADKCGRLRDHLAALVESAEVRATTLIAENDAKLRAQRIATTVQRVTETLRAIDHDQRQSRAVTGIAVQEMTTRLERAYVQLGLTQTQEEFLAGITSEGVSRVLDAQLAESGLQDRITGIVHDLQGLLAD